MSINLDIYPIAGRIGAEIRGVNLSRTLNDSVINEIRKALVQYKVIFFRQQNLSADEQIAFARYFGELTTAHPTLPPLGEHPEVLDLDYGRTATRSNEWHTDVTFVDRPPLGSILRAIEIPPVGGDTIWANTVTAYQDLPVPLQTLADRLWAVHTNAYDYVKPAVTLNEATEAYHKRKRLHERELRTLHICSAHRPSWLEGPG
ncbi:TauD/TfdA dioxygenase family protein [Leptolyngbya sp. 7M]|uniref:TauD/TfdA dioxygenase family protein n=1 Tax=Leptolyngbya sp. 7M TaxID=2812896 RepID=UPI001B8C5AE9|nr:TauD/TfdA family dioxygenase [Leptolyngbya sp. 7M]QYO62939.1 TauD/TfdA family dioxygenase [Leptolyngbya sp. 7M]